MQTLKLKTKLVIIYGRVIKIFDNSRKPHICKNNFNFNIKKLRGVVLLNQI